MGEKEKGGKDLSLSKGICKDKAEGRGAKRKVSVGHKRIGNRQLHWGPGTRDFFCEKKEAACQVRGKEREYSERN